MVTDTVKSARRVVEVFESFAATRRRMTGTEVAELLGYPKSSTNALLRSLVALGYLDVDEIGKSYFPTMRLTLLGEWLPAQSAVPARLEDLLARARDETGETATLSVQAGADMVFVRVLQSLYPIALNLEAGARAPLFGSAVGLALVATMGDEQIEALLRQARRSNGSKPSPAITSAVETVRRRGYALVYEGVLPDTGAIAVALPAGAAATRLVLGVGGPVDRIRTNERSIVRALCGLAGIAARVERSA